VNQPLGSNYPLKNGKASIYEGGTRVPLAISWPGKIKAGSVNHQAIVSSVDIYPTLIDLCGIKIKKKSQLDGVSIKQALMGKTLERDEIYCYFPHYIKSTGNVPSTYVRKGNWKLIKHFYDNNDQTHRYELFNLQTDIGETLNVAEVYPEKVKALNLLIEKHLSETGGVVPIANPNYIK
jgi:arylsulfatase A-like enzyme